MAESCSSSENSVLISGRLASLFGIDIPEDCGISTGFKFLRYCLPLNDKAEFKNISSSTVSASRAARLAKIVFPAAENTRSEGVDVAGIQSNFLAIWLSIGYLTQFCFQ